MPVGELVLHLGEFHPASLVRTGTSWEQASAPRAFTTEMRWLAVVVALWIALVPARTASAGSPRIAARPLIPLGAPRATMDVWLAEVCANPDLACARDPSRMTLYAADADPADVAWGILASEPALARLRWSASASAWVAERVWSFASHVHSIHKDDAQPPFAIRPVLYPIGPGVWGLALVETVVEMSRVYAEGADMRVADGATMVFIFRTSSQVSGASMKASGRKASGDMDQPADQCFGGSPPQVPLHDPSSSENTRRRASSGPSAPERSACNARIDPA